MCFVTLLFSDDATMQQTMLNPTQILNSIGLNPQQHSAAQNAILSIAELSKHLSLDKVCERLFLLIPIGYNI